MPERPSSLLPAVSVREEEAGTLSPSYTLEVALERAGGEIMSSLDGEGVGDGGEVETGEEGQQTQVKTELVCWPAPSSEVINFESGEDAPAAGLPGSEACGDEEKSGRKGGETGISDEARDKESASSESSLSSIVKTEQKDLQERVRAALRRHKGCVHGQFFACDADEGPGDGGDSGV